MIPDFTLGEMIEMLTAIGYKVELKQEEYEIDLTGWYREKRQMEWYSVSYNGECMDDLTGQRKEGSKIVKWIFDQELKEQFKRYFYETASKMGRKTITNPGRVCSCNNSCTGCSGGSI